RLLQALSGGDQCGQRVRLRLGAIHARLDLGDLAQQVAGLVAARRAGLVPARDLGDDELVQALEDRAHRAQLRAQTPVGRAGGGVELLGRRILVEEARPRGGEPLLRRRLAEADADRAAADL